MIDGHNFWLTELPTYEEALAQCCRETLAMHGLDPASHPELEKQVLQVFREDWQSNNEDISSFVLRLCLKIEKFVDMRVAG